MSRGAAQRHETSYAPRGMRLEAAAAWVGFGRTKFLEMVDDGRMPKGKMVDGCRVWDRFRLDEAFEALPDSDGNSQILGWGAVA